MANGITPSSLENSEKAASRVVQVILRRLHNVTALPIVGILTGVNDSGQVVGNEQTNNGLGFYGFLYSDGAKTDLGNLPGGSGSYANSINNSGKVVGWADTAGGWGEHAFVYSNGAMTDLGTFGGRYSRAYASTPTARWRGRPKQPAGPMTSFYTATAR